MKVKSVKWYYIGCLILILAIALFLVVNIVGSKTYLDSDMSSELILAKILAKEGSWFSADWFYSTEIRVFYMTHIAAFLFRFISDYRTVRVLTNCILIMVMLGSFHFFLRSIAFSKTRRVWCEVVLLLPVSGDILYSIQIGGFYSVVLCMNMVFLGGFFYLHRGLGRHLKIFCYLILTGISLLHGLMGVRGFVVLFLPLVGVSIYLCVYEQKFRLSAVTVICKSRQFLRCLWFLLTSVVGYAVNALYLAKRYNYYDYSGTVFRDLRPSLIVSRVNDLISNMIEFFGYRSEKLFSCVGIGNVFAIAFVIAIGIILVFLGIRFDELNEVMRFTYLFILFAAILQLFLLVFTGDVIWARYFIPFGWLLIPMVAEWGSKRAVDLKKVAISVVLIGTVLISSFNTTVMIITEDRNEGLEEVIEFLEREGYTRGIATFWNSNVVQELSGDKVKMTAVRNLKDLEIYPWLMPKENIERKTYSGEKKFLLVDSSELGESGEDIEVQGARLVYRNGKYAVYHCTKEIKELFYKRNGMN